MPPAHHHQPAVTLRASFSLPPAEFLTRWHILRLRIDTRSGSVLTAEPQLDDRVGSVRVVAVSPLGEIYFCTDTALGRLVPA